MRRERGQALAEYVLVLPLLLLLIFGIIDFAIVVLQYNTIANAAREGARAGVVVQGDVTDVVDAAESAAAVLTVGLDSDDLTITAMADAETISVTVDYTARLITGIIIEAVGGDAEIPLSSTATMRRE
ncbi:MAG: TadE family protein [Chloroflexota bacterium]|nr:TadE family protein [Chloroflexota bacterium]